MSGKRALSPILSTMILLTAALLAGILLYNYFTRTLRGMMNTPNPVIEQAVYYPDIETMMIHVKNLGGAPVDLNSSSLVIAGRNATCTCSIVCEGSAVLAPNSRLDVTIYANGTGVTSIPSCRVTCSNYAACVPDLLEGVARVSFRYVYAGSVRSTGFEQIMLG